VGSDISFKKGDQRVQLLIDIIAFMLATNVCAGSKQTIIKDDDCMMEDSGTQIMELNFVNTSRTMPCNSKRTVKRQTASEDSWSVELPQRGVVFR
jgi:hypothetical protein